MRDNMILFFTHLDDYLDVCLGFKKGFDEIVVEKDKLNSKRSSITIEEYNKGDADIFIKYLRAAGVLNAV